MVLFAGTLPQDGSTLKVKFIDYTDKELEVGNLWINSNLLLPLTGSLVFEDDTIFIDQINIQQGERTTRLNQIIPTDSNFPFMKVDRDLYFKSKRLLDTGESLSIAGFTPPEKKPQTTVSTTFSGNFIKPGTIIQGFFDVPPDTGLIQESRNGSDIKDCYYIPKGCSIGKSDSNAQVADDITLHLYNILWNVADLIPGYSMINKGANSNDDWLAKKVINLPSFEERTLTYFSDALQIGKLIGASNYLIGINNVEPHDHGGGNHKPTGTTNTYHNHLISSGHGLSYNATTPYRQITEFANDSRSYYTNHAGNTANPLNINWTGNIISLQGGGQPLQFKEPSLHVQRLLYLGWK